MSFFIADLSLKKIKISTESLIRQEILKTPGGNMSSFGILFRKVRNQYLRRLNATFLESEYGSKNTFDSTSNTVLMVSSVRTASVSPKAAI